VEEKEERQQQEEGVQEQNGERFFLRVNKKYAGLCGELDLQLGGGEQVPSQSGSV